MDLLGRETWGEYMIPVQPQPEPDDFQGKVCVPGQRFLQRSTFPISNWGGQDHWRSCIDDLRKAYGSVCAYSCHWIPGDQLATVDHFIPKCADPQQAYRWDNYRLASQLMNSRKWTYRDVLDPFTLPQGWFILDFPSLLVRPNPDLPSLAREQVLATRARLKLNDETYVGARQEWLELFFRVKDIAWLYQHAPFIAQELDRQGLVDTIAAIMQRRPQP